MTVPSALNHSEEISVRPAAENFPASQRASVRGEREALRRDELTLASPTPWWRRVGHVASSAIKFVAALIYAIPVVPIVVLFLWASGLLRVYRGSMKW